MMFYLPSTPFDESKHWNLLDTTFAHDSGGQEGVADASAYCFWTCSEHEPSPARLRDRVKVASAGFGPRMLTRSFFVEPAFVGAAPTLVVMPGKRARESARYCVRHFADASA